MSSTFMIRQIFIVLSLLLIGCSEGAKSQQSVPPPQRVQATQSEQSQRNIDKTRQNAITHAVEVVAPAVVNISVTEVREFRGSDPFFDFFFGQRSRTYAQEVQGVGSGFVISPDGYIITNDHVAGNAVKISVTFSDGTTFPAEIIGTDRVSDIALIKVKPEKTLPYLSLANSDEVLVGEWAIALGNPFGIFTDAEPTVTVGVISGINRDLDVQDGRVYRQMIQTDAAINQGNSGGPLVNALGEVIGMNTVISSPSGGSVGIGFAVPSNKIEEIVAELKENGTINRDIYTGLYVQDLSNRAIQQLGRRGVLVSGFDEGSPAEKAGFHVNDLLIAIGKDAVKSRSDAVLLLSEYRPGDEIEFVVMRSGEQITLTLRLEKKSS